MAFLAACGDDAGPSIAADAPPLDAACPVPPGHPYIVSRLQLLPPAMGHDVDGDGDVDNELGRLPAADSVNLGLADLIRDGQMTLILHVTDWTEPPTPTDPDIGLHSFGAWDADMPPDPSDNYTGEGEFYIASDHLDINCRSTAIADEATIVDGVLTATKETGWALNVTTGTGAVNFERARLVVTFDASLTAGDSVLGAVMPLCSLSALPFPGDTPGTMLDALANEPSLAGDVLPDVDLDGDGLERVVGDGVGIRECRDGDGSVLPGPDCPCHPAIRDGYSVAFEMGVVTAVVVGVL